MTPALLLSGRAPAFTRLQFLAEKESIAMGEEKEKEQEVINREVINLVKMLDAQLSKMVENEHRMLTLIETVHRRSDANAEETRRHNEEMQRNMDFIVRQQAQFSADMQQLRESQERAELRWERIERRWERTEESVRNLHAIAQIHEREITTLAEAQARTTSQMAETDERINALVNTVERLIGERRNGGQGS